MANDLNQCNFIGRLGRDPEIRYSPAGVAFCNFSIAVGWKSKDKEGAEWVNVITSEKLAEICGEYLKKGSQVFISGRMQTRKWQDKDGADRYTTEIRADRMQMLGSREDGEKPAKPTHGERMAQQRGQAPADRPAPKSSSRFDDMDDDIPF